MVRLLTEVVVEIRGVGPEGTGATCLITLSQHMSSKSEVYDVWVPYGMALKPSLTTK